MIIELSLTTVTRKKSTSRRYGSDDGLTIMSAVLQIIIYTRKLLVRETRDTDFSYNLFNGSKTTAKHFEISFVEEY